MLAPAESCNATKYPGKHQTTLESHVTNGILKPPYTRMLKQSFERVIIIFHLVMHVFGYLYVFTIQQ